MVPLSALVSREDVLALPGRRDGVSRVLSLHVGQRLVLGRCYASQMKGASRDRLRGMSPPRVHWVSVWDDAQLNRLLAAFEFEDVGTRLRVENLTDYSHRPHSLVLGAEKELLIAPGGTAAWRLQDGEVLRLQAVLDSGRREVARLRYDEVRVGHTVWPVLTTDGTRFDVPPEEPRHHVAYLGAWIGQRLELLEETLKRLEKQTLAIRFYQEDVRLTLTHAVERDAAVVHSNEDLAGGLGTR
jgi:hypothetical protein